MQVQRISNDNTSFKQIYIQKAGEKAILEMGAKTYCRLKEGIEHVNRIFPQTKYWDFIIDGKKVYDKGTGKFKYLPEYRYIHKKTGEEFKNLLMKRPTEDVVWGEYACFSANHKKLPPELLLFRPNSEIYSGKESKEVVFDMKEYWIANSYWWNYYSDLEGTTKVYKMLEHLSRNYEYAAGTDAKNFLSQKIEQHNNKYKYISN